MIGKFERESNFPPDKTSCCRASQIFKELAEGNLINQDDPSKKQVRKENSPLSARNKMSKLKSGTDHPVRTKQANGNGMSSAL
jgi:hypothetical protein